MGDQEDWIIDSNGLYVATRSFLIRRGFCCANQCRHCPYINWLASPTWEPLPAEAILSVEVSPKVLEGAKRALAFHERQREQLGQKEEEYHCAIIAHYRLLLKHWEVAVGRGEP